MNGSRNIHQQQQLLIHTENHMPQYEVTTTITITRTRTIDADGVETAKEQAEALMFEIDLENSRATKYVEHDVVEYITPDEDYKLHT
jgi:hypothetical protein